MYSSTRHKVVLYENVESRELICGSELWKDGINHYIVGELSPLVVAIEQYVTGFLATLMSESLSVLTLKELG